MKPIFPKYNGYLGTHLVKATESILFNLGLVTERYTTCYIYNICNVVDDCDNVTYTACTFAPHWYPSDV